MSRHFRPWTIDRTRLLPAAVVDYVLADHLAVRRRFGARAPGSVGDRRKLQKWAWSAAIRSAHDDGPAALCLLLWSLFLAEDREGMRRAGRFHDDRRARRARFSHDRRLQEASSAGVGEAIFAGAEAGGKSRAGEAGACRAGRHEDQGERLQTQGDELRTHEDARDGASRRSGSLAWCWASRRSARGQNPRRNP